MCTCMSFEWVMSCRRAVVARAQTERTVAAHSAGCMAHWSLKAQFCQVVLVILIHNVSLDGFSSEWTPIEAASRLVQANASWRKQEAGSDTDMEAGLDEAGSDTTASMAGGTVERRVKTAR